MTVLRTSVDPRSPEHLANREALLEQIAAVDAEHAKAVAGGGPKYVDRHRQRGKQLIRERIGNRNPTFAPAGTFETRDKRYVQIAAGGDGVWPRLAAADLAAVVPAKLTDPSLAVVAAAVLAAAL